MMRYLLIIVFMSLLTGCFGGGTVVPQDQFYHLADISAEVTKVKKPFGVVAVSPLQSDALHHERTILYSEQSAPLKLNTYYYHHWTEVPGQMIQENLIAYLRKIGFADTVIRYGERPRVDAQISGRIQRFERVLGQGKPKVEVRLELSFISREPGSQFALTKVYDLEREAADDSMEASVAAFSQALQEIYAAFVSDVLHESGV
jgi:ABC-type uncharacterized transport system auxiliary subunit